MKELCQRLGIRRTRSSPFNPQGNGQAERTNRTLAERLAMDLEAMDQMDWDEKLSSALSAIRTVPNCTTGESPHFLVFGSEARTIADVVYSTDNSKDDQTKRQDAFSKTLDRLTAIHGKVRKRMMDENAKRLKCQNKNTRFTPFEEGGESMGVWATSQKRAFQEIAGQKVERTLCGNKEIGRNTL